MRNKRRIEGPSWIVPLLFSVLSSRSLAQTPAKEAPVPNLELIASRWPAVWIASQGASASSPGVFYFRKEIALSAVPQHFWVHVSADNRFVLHVNGSYAAEGPARGDLLHWRFESIDLAPLLHAGTNVLAAVVWNFGDMSPVAQMSSRTGFLMQGDTSAEVAVNTGPQWRVREEKGRMAIGHEGVRGYYAAGPAEKVDGRLLDWVWDQEQADPDGWEAPKLLGHASAREAADSANSWQLTPNPLPAMERRLTDAGQVVRVDGLSSPVMFPDAALTVPPHAHVTLLLDHRTLETAYPELVTSAGRDAVVKLTYSEALYDTGGKKGNRNDIAGRHIEGITDEFVLGGQEQQTYGPLWWRTWRYLQLEITTQTEPLRLDSMRAWFTAYPFEAKATIAGDISRLDEIWNVGWRTARLNAHETYVDAPYWEQLQYVGDTRIQALISYVMTGDARLARQAITNIDDSRVPEGITQSRYPSSLAQFIPPFSLYWVNMVHDYWMYVDDAALVREMVPHTRTVLDWYASHLRPDGLLGKMTWWEFADWTANFQFGVPPEDPDGGSSLLTLQFVAALSDAVKLEARFGSAERVAQYQNIIRKATDTLNHVSWDAAHGLYADTPSKNSWSAEANVLAVMLSIAPADQRRPILRRVLAAQPATPAMVDAVTLPPLSPLSYYFRFYLSRALQQAGMGDEYIKQLGPWYQMLDLGLSTWAETPEPTRSDCHAWSASPNFDLLTLVAGIQPAAPEFSSVLIEPHLRGLHDLKATMPHPKGMISVQYHRESDKWTATIRLPDGLSGKFSWANRSWRLHAGTQVLELPESR